MKRSSTWRILRCLTPLFCGLLLAVNIHILGIIIEFGMLGRKGRPPSEAFWLFLWTGGVMVVLLSTLSVRRLWRYESRRLRIESGHCVNCDYDLRGIHDKNCPECGMRLTQAASGEAKPRLATRALAVIAMSTVVLFLTCYYFGERAEEAMNRRELNRAREAINADRSAL